MTVRREPNLPLAGLEGSHHAYERTSIYSAIMKREGRAMASRLIIVKATYDQEAGVWYVEDSGDLPGVNAWAPSVEELRDKLPAVILDLLEAEGDDSDVDVPIELIAHLSTRARRDTIA
jgi:hypothetical protein